MRLIIKIRKWIKIRAATQLNWIKQIPGIIGKVDYNFEFWNWHPGFDLSFAEKTLDKVRGEVEDLIVCDCLSFGFLWRENIL